EPGPYHDRDDVERWMRQFREAWGELRAEPVELLDAGKQVVALIHMTGRGLGSGVEVQGGTDVHILGFEGDEVSYFRLYPGDIAPEQAGLSEQEREVLFARVQDELDREAIATNLGLPEEVVAERLDGAFEKLTGLPARAQVS